MSFSLDQPRRQAEHIRFNDASATTLSEPELNTECTADYLQLGAAIIAILMRTYTAEYCNIQYRLEAAGN